MAIKFNASSHWYDRDGKPQHDADLRKARKVGLYRSVTSIDKDIFKNPFIEQYKLDRLAEAAFNNPRQPHEDIDEYSTRIYELSLEHMEGAADFGTEFHAAVEGRAVTERIVPFLEKFNIWKADNVIEIVAKEKVLLDHDICVAGTMDTRLIHRAHGLVTADFKTQGIKIDKKTGKKNKPNFYDSYIRQLAFYDAVEAKAAGSFPVIGPCLSIVIDSTEATAPYEKLWSREECLAGYEDFVIAAYAYYKKKNYWPVGRWKLEDKLLQIR
jgi:hypothetical protein